MFYNHVILIVGSKTLGTFIGWIPTTSVQTFKQKLLHREWLIFVYHYWGCTVQCTYFIKCR